MKLFFLLLIYNSFIFNSFCAQSKTKIRSIERPEIVFADEQKLNQLDQIFKEMAIDISKKNRSKEKISEQLKKIKQIFESGLNVNTTFSNDENTLNVICYMLSLSFYFENIKDLKELAQWLLKNGADINQSVGDDGSPLNCTIQNKNLRAAKFLIDNGADINDVDGNEGSHLTNITFFYPQIRSLKKRKNFQKLFILNGAKFTDQKFHAYALENEERVKIFDEVINEIVERYRKRLEIYKDELIEKFSDKQGRQIMPHELVDLITQYSNFSEIEIIENILEIRKMLGK